ncbi:hypothetical protein PVK64_05720 [Aliivibrio sp. S4TY2]|uniref:hypothetical protein n=1 Tax=unclassified Aliivibrio TaxID=2645654 RepID=UPI002378D886|nr:MULTISPECIES: hypothetical protein [unclassified Aliivibrio]MDD9155682.1 hypothetical protein [Aliivibrio sp. S4TY2]MDD9159638.1 hypothetical protein [Aliivibrio sp. S4TY1]MDD9163391.1 hypothetical protein [Aliivibrio sp. S4MY2]MDD9167391.1 hypothetical protein [Aliivibrio sp. S4MY4]MDD9186290.1 hypothetical protein [Aliivibrio sp. S4MY3]
MKTIIFMILFFISFIAYGQCEVEWSIQQQALKQIKTEKNYVYIPLTITFKKGTNHCIDFIKIKPINRFQFKGYQKAFQTTLYNHSMSLLSKKTNGTFILPLELGITTRLWAKVPHPYKITPGEYFQNLELSAINKEKKVLKNKDISLTYDVEPMAELSITGAKINNKYLTYNVDFKALKKGKQKKVRLITYSNALTNLIVTSENGSLQHTSSPSSKVAYEIKIKNQKFIPSEEQKIHVFKNINRYGKNQTPLYLTIKDDTKIKRAGDYTDQITLKLEIKL